MYAADGRQGMRRIVVVDDDPAFSALIGRWLSGENDVDIRFARHASGARELLAGSDWDLLISDVELGDEDGIELVRHAKAMRPTSAALLMTAHEKIEYAIDAVRSQADDFLLKPFDRMTLLGKVSSLLDQARTRNAKTRRSILAIGAHPDDVEIGCGGYLLRARQEGDRVAILTLTDGEQGGLTSQRTKESEAAAEFLGASLLWAGLCDTQVSEGRETIAAIERAIAQVQPDTVILHSKHDSHQDHRNTHMAALVAARGVPNVICYQSPSATLDFRPNLFVDIRAHMGRKIDLIDKYSSQVAKRPYLEPDVLRTTARYWGRFAGYREVEPFEVIRGTN